MMNTPVVIVFFFLKKTARKMKTSGVGIVLFLNKGTYLQGYTII